MGNPQPMAADWFVACDDIDEWSGIIADNFRGLSVRCPQPATAFAGTLAIREMGHISIGRVRSSAARIHHAGSEAPIDQDGRFLVKTQLLGESEIRTDAGMIRMRPGDFVVCDLARPFCLSFDQETEIVSIPIPARFLERFLPNPETVAFRASNRAHAAHGVVSDYLESLLRARGLAATQRQAAQLRDTYFELLVLALNDGDQCALALSTAQAMHLERIKAFIEERLDDETLSIEQIACDLGLSKRYLHAIFSSAGLSVYDYIVTARLALAARLLRAERHSKVTVSEIAYSSGFKSVAHFTRTFKAHYHQTPGAYRARSFT